MPVSASTNYAAYFYPRSPCGERPCIMIITISIASFLSTLSLRRATIRATTLEEVILYFYPRSPCGERLLLALLICLLLDFYPRSPCGERRCEHHANSQQEKFLSTLSLRRATGRHRGNDRCPIDFYPRSPCGERPTKSDQGANSHGISIHALLAESDSLGNVRGCLFCVISIHALLAESDGVHYDNYNLHCVISIHALLAESD